MTATLSERESRAAERSEGPFERLLREFGPALERLAAAYEPEPNEREDLLQEIVFALWRALPSFRGDCSEKTFVYRIAQNRGITHRLRRQTQARRLVELDDTTEVADPATEVEAVDALDRAQLLAAVQRLPSSHRDVLVLSLEGLSNGEIAEVLGMSAGNVGVRLWRARAALRAASLTKERTR